VRANLEAVFGYKGKVWCPTCSGCLYDDGYLFIDQESRFSYRMPIAAGIARAGVGSYKTTGLIAPVSVKRLVGSYRQILSNRLKNVGRAERGK
jgi:hypothetical protein